MQVWRICHGSKVSHWKGKISDVGDSKLILCIHNGSYVSGIWCRTKAGVWMLENTGSRMSLMRYSTGLTDLPFRYRLVRKNGGAVIAMNGPTLISVVTDGSVSLAFIVVFFVSMKRYIPFILLSTSSSLAINDFLSSSLPVMYHTQVLRPATNIVVCEFILSSQNLFFYLCLFLAFSSLSFSFFFSSSLFRISPLPSYPSCLISYVLE